MSTGRGPVKTVHVGYTLMRLRNSNASDDGLGNLHSYPKKSNTREIMKRLGTYKGSRRSSPSPPHIHWIPKRAIRGVDSATYSAVRRLSSNLTSLKISMTNVAQRGRTLRLERKAINLARCPAFSCRSGPCGRRAPAENTSAGLYTQQG